MTQFCHPFWNPGRNQFYTLISSTYSEGVNSFRVEVILTKFCCLFIQQLLDIYYVPRVVWYSWKSSYDVILCLEAFLRVFHLTCRPSSCLVACLLYIFFLSSLWFSFSFINELKYSLAFVYFLFVYLLISSICKQFVSNFSP